MSKEQRLKQRLWARGLGKLGGEKRKAQNPDYSEIGKKGAKARWDKVIESRKNKREEVESNGK